MCDSHLEEMCVCAGLTPVQVQGDLVTWYGLLICSCFTNTVCVGDVSCMYVLSREHVCNTF